MSERQPIGLPTLLRRLNTANVLREIRSHGPISRASIVKATGISQVTVNQIAIGLRNSGRIIEEQGDESSRPVRRGRRMSFLRFNAASGYVLGVDIAPAAVTVLVSDLDAKIVAEECRVATIGQLHPQPLLSLVCSAAKEALVRAGVPPSALQAAGIGVPGRVDPRSGRISFVPALPGWDGLEVGSRLARVLGCPVVVENDMHLAMLAEQGFGLATTRDKNAVYLHLGVGIGLGILVRGELYRGAAGAAGEIAFIPVCCDDEFPEGDFGRFEWAAGSTSFGRLGRRAAEASPSGLIRELSGGDFDRITAQLELEAARQGDLAAITILDKVVKQLARGICAVQCILDPSIIILGGEVARAGAFLVDRLTAEVLRITRPPVGKMVISSLGDHGVALGAVQVALRFTEERLFSVVPRTELHHQTSRSAGKGDGKTARPGVTS